MATDDPDLMYSELLEAESTIARLRQEIAEYADLTGRLSRLLTETANALKGEPGPLTLHDWSDLPVVARQLKQDRDILIEGYNNLKRKLEAADADGSD